MRHHPPFTLAAALAGVLALAALDACEPPEESTSPESEPGTVTLIRGSEGGLDVRHGEPPGGGGGNPLAADDDDDDEYECDDLIECAEKCPVPELDGWTNSCKCDRVGSRWICEVKGFPPGTWPGLDPDAEGGGGDECGGGGGGGIGSGLMKCEGQDIPVKLTCESGTRGERIKCTGRPLISAHDTHNTRYEWSASCDAGCTGTKDGHGKRSKYWSGIATTDARISVRISLSPNDSTFLAGTESATVQVTPRGGWTAAGMGLLGKGKLNKRSLAPRPDYYWKATSWGLYHTERREVISLSTQSGSGPWAGTKYLKKMPKGLLKRDYLYAHPDLYRHGPDYSGSAVCDGSAYSGNVYSVNGGCGTSGILDGWRAAVEAHERKHQSSYNECVTSGWRAAEAVARLEAVAGPDVTADAGDAIKDLWNVLLQARRTNQSWGMPEGMWQRRNSTKWNQVTAERKSHSGTDGC